MSSNLLLFPMFFHVCWVSFLYVILTVLRAPSAWGVDTASGMIRKYAVIEPRVSANLSNQFEWPLLFYVGCVLIISIGSVDSFQVFFAWLFVIGRVIHSCIQILTTNIRFRGAVFTINFIAVVCMWVRLVIVNL